MECGQWVSWLKELANYKLFVIQYKNSPSLETNWDCFYIDIKGGMNASDICSTLYPISGVPTTITISN